MKKTIIMITLVILSISLLLCACTTDNQTGDIGKGTNTGMTTNDDYGKYNVYFGNMDGKGLISEQRAYSQSYGNGNNMDYVGMGREVLNGLFSGPTNTTYRSTVTKNTKVNSISMDNNTQTMSVDLNDGFLDGYDQLGVDENMTIYSIVNSLTDLEGIKQVKITLNGKPLQIKNTAYPNPFTRDTTYIVQPLLP